MLIYSVGNVCGFDTDVWNEKERWDSMSNKTLLLQMVDKQPHYLLWGTVLI